MPDVKSVLKGITSTAVNAVTPGPVVPEIKAGFVITPGSAQQADNLNKLLADAAGKLVSKR